ncbi:MAG: GNAT family N-acetyltransferase [Alphaproteobacteria bacterium]|nr:GNAT family N-acetyltransferase [Alphaproteobacteria bacterium]
MLISYFKCISLRLPFLFLSAISSASPALRIEETIGFTHLLKRSMIMRSCAHYYSLSHNNNELGRPIIKLQSARQFKINLSQNDNVKAELAKLRYLMTHELYEKKYHSQFNLKDQIEFDDLDNYSKFCAIEANGRIVGGGRAILGQKLRPYHSFPAQKDIKYFYKNFSYTHIPVENIAELSRQYVLPLYRNQGGFLAILKGRMALCRQHEITHIFMRISLALNERYKAYGLHFKPVSVPFDDRGTLRQVYFTEIEQFLNELRASQPEIWKYVTDTKGLL